MASILRQIVAGPRLQHPEANLDLCYVTDNVIATSGPSSNFPQRAYRNPLDELVNFLDAKHGENWCIWEFRAEGTGYPDEEVYGRIHHYPFPDHHPPPFALIPAMMGSMKNWLQRLDEPEKSRGHDKGADDEKKGKRVVVVHCKAGKGRSGTVACSYLISQEGWKIEDALQRFTERRMRAGFGHGVSIPSQLRWVRYVDRWANQMDRKYVERPVEILEVHVWGLRDGVKVAVEGYIDEGKKIKNFHLFHRNERTVVDNGKKTASEKDDDKAKSGTNSEPQSAVTESSAWSSQTAPSSSSEESGTSSKHTRAVIFRPNKPVIVPTSDVNIDFERRSKAAYTGWAMVTSIAHVWFNTYFEGGDKEDSGVFEIEWDAMDGIKGTSKKGTRALDRLKVVWRYPTPSQLGIPKPTKESTSPISGQTITEPKPGETAPESSPADWRGQETGKDSTQTIRNQENIPVHLEPAREGDQPRGESEGEGAESQSNNQSYLGAITASAASAATTAAHSIQELGKELGLRQQTAESQDVSLAESDDNSSVLGRRKGKSTDKKEDQEPSKAKDENGDFEGTQPYFANGKDSNGKDASSGKKDG